MATMLLGTSAPVCAQSKKDRVGGSEQIRGKKPSKQEKLITVRGQIDQSQNGGKFTINVKEIETTLNQQVELERAPFPKDWDKFSAAAKVKWVTQFEATEIGRGFVARNKQILDDAPAFNLRFSPEGEFVVYDVPPGVYGLQGRVDKKIDGILHAFEVFAQIEISPEVDQVTLDALPVLVTPLLESGTPAPKIDVLTHDGQGSLTLEAPRLKGKYVFVNFWSTDDFQNEKAGVDHQQSVQDMVAELKDKYDLTLLNICLDEDRGAAKIHIVKNKYEQGLHGFTDGREHETVDLYGVRSTPTGFLVDPDRSIAMSQYEFYNLTKMKDSLTTVIEDRLTGKDKPTLAEEKETEER